MAGPKIAMTSIDWSRNIVKSNRLLISYSTLWHLVYKLSIITKLVSAMTSFLGLLVCSYISNARLCWSLRLKWLTWRFIFSIIRRTFSLKLHRPYKSMPRNERCLALFWREKKKIPINVKLIFPRCFPSMYWNAVSAFSFKMNWFNDLLCFLPLHDSFIKSTGRLTLFSLICLLRNGHVGLVI